MHKTLDSVLNTASGGRQKLITPLPSSTDHLLNSSRKIPVLNIPKAHTLIIRLAQQEKIHACFYKCSQLLVARELTHSHTPKYPHFHTFTHPRLSLIHIPTLSHTYTSHILTHSHTLHIWIQMTRQGLIHRGAVLSSACTDWVMPGSTGHLKPGLPAHQHQQKSGRPIQDCKRECTHGDTVGEYSWWWPQNTI